MTRITLTLFSLLFAASLFAQTADATKGCAPMSVKFTAPAGATAFFWDFKDGATSSLSNPSNTFTTPGTYDVEFRNSQSGPVVGTLRITVFPKPDLDITATPMGGCVPLSVAFSDVSKADTAIKVLNRLWVYGDGGGAAAGANPNYLYNTVGTFSVSLEWSTNFATCNVTEIFADKIRVSNKPAVNFATTPAAPSACVPPLLVSFSNTTPGSGLSFQWSLGNGVTSSLTNPPAQGYIQNGTYPVKLIATDANGCSDSIVKVVSVGLPLAAFDIKDTICIRTPTTFRNTSAAGTYAWNFGAGAVPVNSSQFSPVVTFSTPGPRTVTLTVTAPGGCSSTVSKVVYVDEVIPTFTVNPTYSCNRPTIFNITSQTTVAGATFEWSFSDGSTSTAKNPVYTWRDPDVSGFGSSGLKLDTIEVTVTYPSGCTASALGVDTVWLPNARFMPDVQHGCAPLTVTFADSSFSNEPIDQWTWLYDDGSAPEVKTNGNPTAHTFNTPGEYEVRLVIRNSRGCVDTSYSVLIEVGEKITGDFDADKTEVCPGDTVKFTNLTTDPRVDGWHFSSEGNRQWHCFQDKNPDWQFNSQAGPGDVSLIIEYNGCFNTITKTDFIKVKGPIANLHYKTTCANTLSFDFEDQSQDATSIKWYLGDGDSSIQKVFTHVYKMPGQYTVILKAENPGSGCPVSCDTAIVYPTILKANFDLPDVICAGQPQMLDGSLSTDVNGTEFKGYTWYFSFQRPIRTDTAVIDFTFNAPGPQLVWLEVEDINGCLDTLRDSVNVYNGEPLFKVSDSLICLPATIAFTDIGSTADTTIVKWEWEFGDGAMGSGPNATHTYTNLPPGVTELIVTYKITDKVDCPFSASFPIKVYKPESRISTIPVPPNICIGESITFSATDYTLGGSNLRWEWLFSNSTPATGQTTTQTFNQEGSIPVKLTYTEIATGCTDMIETGVRVQAPPVASFTSNVDNTPVLCAPQNIVLTNTSTTNSPPLAISWNLGNGVTSAGPMAATVFPKGTYTVEMIATTTFGCADTTTRSFTVVGPSGNFDLDNSTICRGGSIALSIRDTADVGGFFWDFGDGSDTIQNKATVTHRYGWSSFPLSGVIPVRLILRGEDPACSFAVEKPLSFSRIDASFDPGPNPLCLGATHAFRNASSAADEYSWTFGDGGTSTAANPTHKYGAIGNYSVKLIVTDLPLGCKDTAEQVARIVNANTFAVTGDSICAGNSGTLKVSIPEPNAVYTWSPASLVTTATGSTVQTVPLTRDTTLTVSYTDAIGCISTASASVVVGDDPEVFFPNAFTPGNGDTLNNVFRALLKEGACQEADIETMSIYSRWGEKMFESKGPISTVAWDGNRKGEPGLMDTYVWYAVVRFKSGNTKTFKGELNLLR